MPIHLGDDGASIIIEDEVFDLDPKTAAWFAEQPDPDAALIQAIEWGAVAMENGGFVMFDAETQTGTSGMDAMVPIMKFYQTLSPPETTMARKLVRRT